MTTNKSQEKTLELNVKLKELQLQDRELSIKEKELFLKNKELDLQSRNNANSFKVEVIKVVVTGIVVTLVPALINHQIQEQNVEIERLKAEQVYLKDFATEALQDDLRKRLNFADYLATIAHSRDSRARWTEYRNKISTLITEQISREQNISEVVTEINQLQQDDLTPEEAQRRNELIAQVDNLEAELNQFREQQQLQPFIFTQNLDSRIVEGARFTWKEALTSRDGTVSLPENQEIVSNIIQLALKLKIVEERLGKPITIVEWYRSKEVNARAGGTSRSQHLFGRAVNIRVEGMSSTQVFDNLDSWWVGGLARPAPEHTQVSLDDRGFRVRWTAGSDGI